MDLAIAPLDHELPLVRQVGGKPVIAGVGAGVEDALCPGCGESVLLADVTPSSVYDLAIECSRCGTVAATRSLVPGEGLGGAALVVPVCGVRADTTFVADCDQIVVGEPGAQRRRAETGEPRKSAKRIELDVDGIAAVLDLTRDVFARSWLISNGASYLHPVATV
jgi:ribosomal protein S27AE